MSLKHVKICGITNKPTLDACLDIGVGFVGFNFVPLSPRYICVSDAVALSQNMPVTVAKVALIVNETDDMIHNIVTTLKPDYIQLHGTESIDAIIAIKQKFNIKIIKAIGIANADDINTAKKYFNHADMMLFDAKPSHNSSFTGGHGIRFDWSLLHGIDTLNKPFMLAGGLNQHNLMVAQSQSHADYFDICSGVEERKGQKSVALIHALKDCVTKI